MTKHLTFLFLCFASYAAFGQSAPGKISYQAVVRDPQGNELVDQFVTVEFAVHRGTPDGDIVFSESHSLVPTNQFGLFSTMIGTGIVTGDGLYAALTDVPWESDEYYLEVSAGQPGSPPQVVGISQMLTVPYSYYSTKAGSVVNESDGDTTNELIENVTLEGTTLTIVEQGESYAVDLGNLTSDFGNDELINDLELSGNMQLSVTEGTSTSTVDLTAVAYATWNENTTSVYTQGQLVGINTAAPQSTLEVNGSLALKVAKLNAGTTNLNTNTDMANRTVFICDVAMGDVSIQLLPAANCSGRVYKFRKFFTTATTSNDVVITPFAGDEIDGSVSYTMTSTQAEYLTLVSDGQDWYIIDHYHE
jgi:hypothetical protein